MVDTGRSGGGAAAGIAALMLFVASCSGESKQATGTSTPAAVPATIGAATPSAAGISGTPQQAGAGAPAGQGEAVIARIRLFTTDLPPGWSERSVTIAAPWEGSADDPRRAHLQAGLTSGEQIVYTDIWLFKSALAARARLEEMAERGLPALREHLQGDGARYLVGAEGAATVLDIGEGAHRFPLKAAEGQPEGAVVVSTRGAILSTVIVRGTPDAVALARVLDSRALATQR